MFASAVRTASPRIHSSIRSSPIISSTLSLQTRKMSAAPYTVVATDKAPKAIGPYVQAVKHNGVIYASGSIPFIPETMEIIEGGIEAQAEQMFKNVQAVMDGANTDASHVLKTTVFLKDMGDFAKFNTIYEKFYSPYKPARSCVEVARLPKDVLCELEFIAVEKK